MQSIKANVLHQRAENLMSNSYREENAAFVGAAFIATIGTLFGIVALFFGLISGNTDLGQGPTAVFGLQLLLGSGIIYALANFTFNLGRKHRVKEHSETATLIYRALLPHNQEIAKPLVLKVYELEKQDIYGGPISERMDLLREIRARDDVDKSKSKILVDNSDVEAVKAILVGFKKLES